MDRTKGFAQAVLEAIDLCMASDARVFIMGLGVPDPRGIFGTTLGLQEKYGEQRVMDMPCSENGMTGVAIGSALVGMRPILTHQRVDFALLSLDQIVNQAAKWHFMFGGKASVPLVIRMIVGRGWGQGPQHSQSLEAWFAHVPGLKVVMPTTPFDAKGLLISSIEDDNPVLFIEHRWLHNITGHVPEGSYRVPLGKGKILRNGNDLTVVATSYMTLEALRAAEVLEGDGLQAEVIDVRTLRPLDEDLILESVTKTGRLIVVDTGQKTGGFGGEILARVAEGAFSALKAAPVRIGLPDCPSPTTHALAEAYYPTANQIVAAARTMLGIRETSPHTKASSQSPADVPNPTFTGPF